ncbi:cytochrome C554 [Limnohabitans sp. T6-5]|uniref:c-type cytochrome n=1 Tax=Limnohabitans sp. T6-5 TaxID=1100724 RepID=UPI000D346B8E|nr:cytochrome c [Limnohabitans sp. T6-5]PUE11772.1 cytochrome C554 [Limnohabitans sp. T6-5]
MKNILLILMMAVMSSCFADDVTSGKAKADVACALCHGPNGIATLPNAPNLAGQQAFYVSEQLKSYRSGQRQNAVMGVIAKPLTDAEISQLAAWYSAIKVTVELP